MACWKASEFELVYDNAVDILAPYFKPQDKEDIAKSIHELFCKGNDAVTDTITTSLLSWF